MNKNVAVFILLSIVFGLGAVFLAKNWLDKNQSQTVEVGQAQVITVNAALQTGSIIEAKHLTVKTIPESMVPEGAVTRLEDATGMIAKSKLYNGDILHTKRIAKKGEGSSLASLISPHMRAVSIRVNDVVGVSGFILPGNTVDILITYRGKSAANTEVVLSNIKILAVDQRASNDENKPQIVRAVTLEVTLEQAETLMSAQNKGSLQLALRNPNDKAEVALFDPEQDEKAFEQAAKEASSETQTVAVNSLTGRNKVEIIRGIEKESVQVSNN
ncbi:Flp pilus assembly protein CpaB [Thalassotalea psychrophila]|uniref:Flp pilus assembly protein CpaB n=1 Tax=Thalassotalea psychrophila TaxID=3065647 RepID=A0ABY9TY94_9GAMM|nr:Flp pilus assembly protein CpaB [Colwelliaceae bacterium SQ149]